MKTKVKIYFRADGNSNIGIGHVTRVLALIEMLEAYFECCIVIQNPDQSLLQYISNVCNNIVILESRGNIEEDIDYFINSCGLISGDIVVLDGYQFGAGMQRSLKSHGCKVVYIDDLNKEHIFSDVVINHSGGFKKELYSVEKYTELYLGPQYAFLRKPFRKVDFDLDEAERCNNIFICFGGSDPSNETLKVLKLCEAKYTKYRYYVVISKLNKWRHQIENFLNGSQVEIELLSDLTAVEMAFYMRKCGKAITSASTVSYEYLSIGGELYLRNLYDNQKGIFTFLIENSYAHDFKDFPLNNKLETISNLKDRLIDGNQEKRFRRLFLGLAIEVRKATLDDCERYFQWVNNPEARKQSFDSSIISFKNHSAWFRKNINSKDAELFVMELQKLPIGQVRFNLIENISNISYSLDENFRGYGLGYCILKKGIRVYRNSYPNAQIIGFVKKTNIASMKVFKSLGFKAEDAVSSIKYVL